MERPWDSGVPFSPNQRGSSAQQRDSTVGKGLSVLRARATRCRATSPIRQLISTSLQLHTHRMTECSNTSGTDRGPAHAPRSRGEIFKSRPMPFLPPGRSAGLDALVGYRCDDKISLRRELRPVTTQSPGEGRYWYLLSRGPRPLTVCHQRMNTSYFVRLRRSQALKNHSILKASLDQAGSRIGLPRLPATLRLITSSKPGKARASGSCPTAAASNPFESLSRSPCPVSTEDKQAWACETRGSSGHGRGMPTRLGETLVPFMSGPDLEAGDE